MKWRDEPSQEFYVRHKDGTMHKMWPLPLDPPDIMYFPWPDVTGFSGIGPGEGKVLCKRRPTTNLYEEV